MWDQYIKEREGFETIKNDKGFVVYKIFGEECYIRDIFVVKEFRRTNVATELADEVMKVAKDAGCSKLTGTIVPHLPGSTGSMFGLMSYGFKLHSVNGDTVILSKEI